MIVRKLLLIVLWTLMLCMILEIDLFVKFMATKKKAVSVQVTIVTNI